MKKKILVTMLILVTLGVSLSVAVGTDDPLITESYLNDVFLKEVKEYIRENGSGSSFSVVSVSKGQKFIGNAGCEFILRMGQGTVISAELGGLSDVTGGVDITSGVPVPPNHMLIIPRDDGRGFEANTDVIIMVKGSYTIK